MSFCQAVEEAEEECDGEEGEEKKWRMSSEQNGGAEGWSDDWG